MDPINVLHYTIIWSRQLLGGQYIDFGVVGIMINNIFIATNCLGCIIVSSHDSRSYSLKMMM